MLDYWTFFSNHGHVMVLVGSEPTITFREIALKVGITERFAQKVVSDLVRDGYLKIHKIGRQNSYEIVEKKRLRHELEKECTVADLVNFINGAGVEND